jgi:hypothetical protein
MAGGKRPLSLKKQTVTKASTVEDKETPFDLIVGMDQASDEDDGDTSDSSVYSELEGKKQRSELLKASLKRQCICKGKCGWYFTKYNLT